MEVFHTKLNKNKPRPKDQWYRVEGTHEPIIDRELWDNVQALIAQKSQTVYSWTNRFIRQKKLGA